MAVVAIDSTGSTGRSAPADRTQERALAVCEAVGAFIEAWGFKSIHGRVWCLLALRTHPMSQVEVAHTLGVSRALVSLAISELSERGLVRPTEDRRNAPYEACMDVWPTITDVWRKREWMMMEQARMSLEGLLDEAEYAARSGAPGDYNVERIRTVLEMTEFAQVVLRAMLSLRIPRSLEGFGEWLSRSKKLVRKFQGTFTNA